MFRATRRGILVGASIGFLALAGGMLPMTVSTDADAQELEEVRFGLGPYFEYQPWAISKDLGLDKEMGFDFVLQTVNKVAHAVAGLQSDQYHLTMSCQTCTIPFYANVPTLRNWMVTNQFKGFAIIGRRGQTPTYAELLPELGHEKAKEEVLLSMKGKTFAIVKVNHGPMVDSALQQVGLSLDDVEVLNFPDHPSAGFAFESGEGDFYTGALPQQIRLLTVGDEYVNVGGHEILGPAGLWYSTMLSDQTWLEENEERTLKLLAIWYRTMRYVEERFDYALPIWTASLNERMGSDTFSVDQTRVAIEEFEFFPTMEEAAEGVFNSDSDLSWRNSVAHYLPNVENVPEDFTVDDYEVHSKYYDALIANEELVAWINAPLK